jgi:hypothetical protein
MAIMRVHKDDALLRDKGNIAIVRVRKNVKLLMEKKSWL